VAVSCTVVPLAIEGFGGVTVIDVSTAGVTVTVVVPDTPARVAVMVVIPTPVPVTRAALLTAATVGSDEIHVTDAVRS